jgi:CRISPR-associated RAMP protein (TIGR02581 family)
MSEVATTLTGQGPASDWIVTVLDVELTCRSGLRIAGPSDRDDVDIAVHRDHGGVPLVPGSSLKGVMRSLAERVLAAHSPGLACDILANPCLGQPGQGESEPGLDELEQLCWCCQVFGSPHRGSRLFVGDLHTDDAPTVVRDGVGIDRGELRAADGIKFDYEVVVPDTVFSGELRLEGDTSTSHNADIGLVLGLLELIDAGATGLGGGTSRGLGRVGIRCVGARELRASTWQPGQGFTPLDDGYLATCRQAATQKLAARTGGRFGG